MIDLIDGESVLQAIDAAGGLKSTARTGEVIVVRRGEGNQRLAFAVNLDQGKKRFLDLQLKNVVNRRPSGLVRFSYKLSFFQIVGLVICGLEAIGV